MNKLLSILFISMLFAIVLGISGCSREAGANISAAKTAEKTVSYSPADKRVAKAEDAIAKLPGLAKSHLALAAAILAKVRETGDYSLNRRAEVSINKALEIEPENFDAQILQTQIYLSEHKFSEALELAQKLEKVNPKSEAVLAAITDAQTELGMYEEAVKSAQKFVDTRPNAASYTRVAHIRSLHGDVTGAIQARQMALRIADPMDSEGLAWYHSELGKEYWNAGKFAEAESNFDKALEIFPDYHWALAGKGKILAGRGEHEKAIAAFEKLNSRAPEADRAIYLGDLYKIIGKNEQAQKAYEDAVRREREAAASDGGGELHRIAQFWADSNTNLDEALEIAQQDRAENGDLAASDTLAWCLFKKGRYTEAKKYMAEAMRLKTKNALFYFHLGMIENAVGNRLEALKYLKLSLETNPAFDLLHTETAKETLASIKG